jgi:hypothetical protein
MLDVLLSMRGAADLLLRRMLIGPDEFIAPCARSLLESVGQSSRFMTVPDVSDGLSLLAQGGKIENPQGRSAFLKQVWLFRYRLDRAYSSSGRSALNLFMRERLAAVDSPAQVKISGNNKTSLGEDMQVFFDEFRDIASCIGRLAIQNPEAARHLLRSRLFPEENIRHVADFGAGTGIASLVLAERYPRAEVWSVEIGPIELLRTPNHPGNIINFNGHDFLEFLGAYALGLLPSMDLIYNFFPTPTMGEEGDLKRCCLAIYGLLSKKGLVHFITESPFVVEEVEERLGRLGLQVRYASIPDLFGGLSTYSFDCDNETSSSDLYWLIAHRS